MKNNIKEILTYEIKKGVGLGDIYFGMSQKDFIEQYVCDELINDGYIAIRYTSKGKNIHYKFFDSVEVEICIDNGVRSIFVENQFKGKYKNNICIGSLYKDVKSFALRGLSTDISDDEKKKYIHYDDDVLCLGEDYNFQIIFNIEDMDKMAGLELINVVMYYDEIEYNSMKIKSIFLYK